MKIDLYSTTGQKKEAISICDELAKLIPNIDLINEGLRYQKNNRRQVTAHVKNKSDRQGGGRKPFNQKGGGRARQGSIRNPHYRGGGVAFGPKSERNFKIKMPRKQRRLALMSALKSKLDEKKVFALEGDSNKLTKTKDFVDLLKKLPVERSVLFISPEKDTHLRKTSTNIKSVKVLLDNYLNIYDLLKFDKICFLQKSLDNFTTRVKENS